MNEEPTLRELATALRDVIDRLDRIERKVDGLDQRTTERFAGVRQMFASLGGQEARHTGSAGDD